MEINLYYINLFRSQERNKTIRKNMSCLFKNIYRVEAFDFENPTNETKLLQCCYQHHNCTKKNLGEATAAAAENLDNNNICHGPESFVSYSHIKAILMAYNHNCEEAFICEDDVYCDFKDKFDFTIKEIINRKPKDAECIIFYQTNKNAMEKSIAGKKMFQKYTPLHNGAVIYYITREGMEKIISSYYNVATRVFDLSSLKCNMVSKNLIEYQTSKYNSERVIFSLLKTYIYSKPTFNIKANIPSTIGHAVRDIFFGIMFINNYFHNKLAIKFPIGMSAILNSSIKYK